MPFLNWPTTTSPIACRHRPRRAEFSDPHWQAFWRTAVDGVPAAEVAEELNYSTAAVYQAKSRVLARLREMLGDENHGQ